MQLPATSSMPHQPLLVRSSRGICQACGADPSCCPTCEGTGEVLVDDKHPDRTIPPEANILPVTCPTCNGDRRHVCLMHPCGSGCGRTAEVFNELAQFQLCRACNEAWSCDG